MLPPVRWILLVLLVACPAARAQDDMGRADYRDGVREYDLAEYKLALEAFKRSYLKSESPKLLYNIAQCHRQLGNKAEAVRFYRQYLAFTPDASDRAEIEKLANDLEQAVARETALRNRPPKGPEPPSSDTPAAVAPPVAVVPAPAPASPPAAASPTPITHRWWLWTAVAAGVLVVAGVGVAVGIAASADTAAPDTLQYTVRFP